MTTVLAPPTEMLADSFLRSSRYARAWRDSTKQWPDDAPDCFWMARAFTAHCRNAGVGAEMYLGLHDPREGCDDECDAPRHGPESLTCRCRFHAITVMPSGEAVDWTAKQFGDDSGGRYRSVEEDPLYYPNIPVPLIWEGVDGGAELADELTFTITTSYEWRRYR